MDVNFNGKVVLVTGGTRGIGYAMVKKFAAAGADIAFTYVTSGGRAETVEQELAGYGVKVKSYRSDAANYNDTLQLVNCIRQDFGRIDILVNNAGITQDTLMLRMKEDAWDNVINTNLKSAFNFINACSPIMLSQRSGCIISVSSVVGLHGNAGQSNYAASKAGLIGLSKSVALELGSRGIRCNVIAPGFIFTEMTRKLPEAVLAEWNKKIPLRRAGSTDEVASVALFLASDLASYITGQVITIDGGMSM